MIGIEKLYKNMEKSNNYIWEMKLKFVWEGFRWELVDFFYKKDFKF